MYLQYECKEPVSYPALQWWNQPRIGAEWLFGGTGVGKEATTLQADLFAAEEFAPNIQYHFLPVAINYNGSNAVKEHGFNACRRSMRSPSRGHVRIKSRDPHQHPGILFNYYVARAGLAGVPRRNSHHTRDHASTRAGSISRAKSALVSNARRMSSSMSSCVTTPKPRFIRAVPAKWVMTRWLWLTAKAAYTGWKASAWWMRQLCRKLSPAI